MGSKVPVKSNTTDKETEQKDDVLPHITKASEADNAYNSLKLNTMPISVKSAEGNKVVSPDHKNEQSENISRGFDPLSIRKKEGKLCSEEVDHYRQNSLELSEKNKVQQCKKNIQNVSTVQTSGTNLCYRKPTRMPPLIAVDGITPKLFPETSWSQKKDTLHVTIHLVGVEQYKCCVKSSHLFFK